MAHHWGYTKENGEFNSPIEYSYTFSFSQSLLVTLSFKQIAEETFDLFDIREVSHVY